MIDRVNADAPQQDTRASAALGCLCHESAGQR
jgi:hypothetical protein